MGGGRELRLEKDEGKKAEAKKKKINGISKRSRKGGSQ